MKHTYLLTGYPGFLATNLIKQLVHDHGQKISHIYVLVLPDLQRKAADEIRLLAGTSGISPDTFSIVPGDITKEELGIASDTNRQLKKSITHVFHLAAIYDLAVSKELAYKVNVTGTRNMNNWVKKLDSLMRYVYFSTAYVSGTREGKIFETELSEGQSFKNHYEETKYDAEILVEDLKPDIPTTILRPGIVRGHSQTGDTLKFDGIYFLLNMFEALSRLPIIPYIGEGQPEGNFVPYDYVLKASSYLTMHPAGEGKTYHLTDPNPYTMHDIYTIIAQKYLGKTPKGIIPLAWSKKSLTATPLRNWLRVEQEAMNYFTINASFDSSMATSDLAGSGIVCPDFIDTLDPMIQFYRKYKHDRRKHIAVL
ncbi:SDR family oxidoreductase [Lentibacillus amyloliquefaciens]|uniref:3-beta hydroxysteroid dehydrogenase n=1 Tax=Lentibacillus amyloliquefaciens TaxID=1472767 RepID=A0A0U4F5D1_9BACI|nr:SDR family oxidoreductase [Lentibacillus amyloliquefaciens]ALX48806.1 3-beta hydroxysteroid dehydrogenase [Lentibacillus amyloliquefaciens]